MGCTTLKISLEREPQSAKPPRVKSRHLKSPVSATDYLWLIEKNLAWLFLSYCFPIDKNRQADSSSGKVKNHGLLFFVCLFLLNQILSKSIFIDKKLETSVVPIRTFISGVEGTYVLGHLKLILHQQTGHTGLRRCRRHSSPQPRKPHGLDCEKLKPKTLLSNIFTVKV